MKIIGLPTKAAFLVILEAFDVCLISVDSARVSCRVTGLCRRAWLWVVQFSRCWAQWMRHEIGEGLVFATFLF